MLSNLAWQLEAELGGMTGEGMDAYEREDLTDELRALKRIARTLGRQLER